MRSVTRLFLSLTLLLSLTLSPSPARANDGANRYRPPVPPVLVHFPAPESPAAGYVFLPADGPDGSDGDDAFRWAVPHAVAAVRIAARETVAAVPSPGGLAMAVFDLSAENADTPVERRPGKPPRGRHPGDSHDGGLNLDLGYYLTSLRGRVLDPDRAACTDHYRPAEGGGLEDAHACTGPADRLDLDREAYFLLALFRVNRERFDGDLLEEVGIDARVAEAVLAKVRAWATDGRHGASAALADDLARVLTCDRWEGWRTYHHHHVHLRFRDLATYGRHRAAVEALLARERDDDAAAAGPAGTPSVRARLVSYRLERSLEVEVSGTPATWATFVAARQAVGAPREGGRLRAVLDLPGGPRDAGGTVEGSVRLGPDDGNPGAVLRFAVPVPRLDAAAFVTVDPARLEASAMLEGAGWTASLRLPEPYRAYVTGVAWEVGRADGSLDAPVAGDGPGFAARLPDPAGRPPARLVRAVVELSGRKRVPVTAWVGD